MNLNAAEAQWRNVQQQYENNDRQETISKLRNLSRDHVGATAADIAAFPIQFYTGLNRQRTK